MSPFCRCQLVNSFPLKSRRSKLKRQASRRLSLACGLCQTWVESTIRFVQFCAYVLTHTLRMIDMQIWPKYACNHLFDGYRISDISIVYLQELYMISSLSFLDFIGVMWKIRWRMNLTHHHASASKDCWDSHAMAIINNLQEMVQITEPKYSECSFFTTSTKINWGPNKYTPGVQSWPEKAKLKTREHTAFHGMWWSWGSHEKHARQLFALTPARQWPSCASSPSWSFGSKIVRIVPKGLFDRLVLYSGWIHAQNVETKIRERIDWNLRKLHGLEALWASQHHSEAFRNCFSKLKCWQLLDYNCPHLAGSSAFVQQL